MKKFLIFILFAIFMGCNTENNSGLDLNAINKLVIEASKGDKFANDSLGGLFNKSLPEPKTAYEIKVQEYAVKGNILFAVSVQNTFPLYNRFAIYDKNLKLFLLDESLNGKFSVTQENHGKKSFVKLIEEFKSKDSIILNRTSYYNMDSVKANLSFRSFTLLKLSDKEFKQEITSFDDSQILTNIIYSTVPTFKLNDNFLLEEKSGKYISDSNIFDSITIKQINAYEGGDPFKQITDNTSALKFLGIIRETSIGSFTLSHLEGWERQVNVNYREYLDSIYFGVKYTNKDLKTTIFVVELAQKDSVEKMIDFGLLNSTSGNYLVRYSNNIDVENFTVRFFEFSCKNKKFLMIIESEKSMFQKNKEMLQLIINSFKMDC